MTHCLTPAAPVPARTLAALAVVCGLAAPARAGVIFNAEPNDTFATAQDVTASFSLTFNENVVVSVPGGYANNSLVTPHVSVLRPGGRQTAENLDYFKFTTTGGVVVADVTSAPVETNFDTMIFLFDAGGNLLASNDDKGDLTAYIPGDLPGLVGGQWNSRIETAPLPAGTYYLGVGLSFATAGPGGQITGGPFGGGPNPVLGSYTLNVSAAVPQTNPVPEPASLALFGIGLGAVVARRRRG